MKHARVDAIDRTLLLKGEKEIIQKNSRFVEEKFQVSICHELMCLFAVFNVRMFTSENGQ